MHYYIDRDELNDDELNYLEETDLSVTTWRRPTTKVNLKAFYLNVLPKFKNLQSLILTKIPLNNLSLKGISFDFIPLRALMIYKCGLLNTGFNFLCEAINKLETLEDLYLCGNELSDITHLKVPNLKVLTLGNNKLKQKQYMNLKVIVRYLPQLTDLGLESNHFYVEASNHFYVEANYLFFIKALKNANHLELLDLRENRFIFDSSFLDALENGLPVLNKLYLTTCWSQTRIHDAIRFKQSLVEYGDEHREGNKISLCFTNNIKTLNRIDVTSHAGVKRMRDLYDFCCKLYQLGIPVDILNDFIQRNEPFKH